MNFLHPYLGLHRPKDFAEEGCPSSCQEAFGHPQAGGGEGHPQGLRGLRRLSGMLVRQKGAEYIDWARPTATASWCVAGRPYHIDPEINHGINDLITCFGFVLVTEDAVCLTRWAKQPRTCAQPVDATTPGCTTPPGMSAPSRTWQLAAAGLLRLRHGRHHHRRASLHSGARAGSSIPR